MIFIISRVSLHFCGIDLPFKPQYLLFDLAWIAIIIVAFLWLPFREQSIQLVVLSLLFFITCLTDFKYYTIPNIVLIVFALPAIANALWGTSISMLDAGIGGLSGFLLFVTIAILGEKVFKREALGGGDIKLVTVLGLYIGWRGIKPMLFFGSFMALTGYGSMYIWRRRIQPNIPFGPFLILGSILSVYLTDWLINFLLTA